MKKIGLDVAVIGATGAVGEVFMRVAFERNFPIRNLRLLASSRSAGKQVKYGNEVLTVLETNEEALEGVDLVFCSASSEVSKVWGAWCREREIIMIDDGSAFRMDEDVPLVIPEVNGNDLDAHNWIISIPNCTTTPLVMALNAMQQVSSIKRVTAATYQAVSGTGAAAVQELIDQNSSLSQGSDISTPEAYPVQIAQNVLPHVDDFGEGGFTKEELKMRNETRKILHDYDLPFVATCVRVPVLYGHSEVVHVEFTSEVSLVDLGNALSLQDGLVFDDDQTNYVTPLEAADCDDTFVSRLRFDPSVDNGVVFWCVSDNLRKGAATNAIQIAESLLQRGILSES